MSNIDPAILSSATLGEGMHIWNGLIPEAMGEVAVTSSDAEVTFVKQKLDIHDHPTLPFEDANQ